MHRALLLATLLAACRSTDPAFYTKDGQPLEEVAPLLYRVGVAPVEDFEALADAVPESKYEFVFDADDVQARLVEGMGEVKAANEIVLIDRDAVRDAQGGRPDLLLRPRLAEIDAFTKRGRTGRSWLATSLWFTTWYAGLKVEDREYDAPMSFDFEVVNPHTGDLLDSFTVRSDRIPLTFHERSRTPEKLQTAVLPPFLARDNAKAASQVLSERVVARIAARAAGYLKQDFKQKERDLVGEVRLLQPRNGAPVGREIDLEAVVLGREEITACDLYVNDAPVSGLFGDAGLPSRTDQRSGSLFRVPIRRTLALEEGTNRIAVEFRVGGMLTSRTLLFESKVTEEDLAEEERRAAALAEERPAEAD